MRALKLAFYCNLPHPGRPADPSWQWGAPSIETGLGGSEEAVVYLARELALLGHAVSVFNSCGDMRGQHDGVHYEPLSSWDPREARDVVIAWRRLLFIEQEVAARCRVLWLHDAPEIPDWLRAAPGGDAYLASPERMADALDLVAVVSRFQASLLPGALPPEKLLLTRNGIHVPQFTDASDAAIERDPQRVIYAVSYSRGLEHLLRMWPRVHAQAPASELHIFYGWDTVYDDEQRARLRALLDQPAVFEHGQIGHAELVREYRRAGVFAYPCDTPEMFSISTVKAQAAGCVPLVTAQGALSEVTRHGVVVPGRGGEPETDARFERELVRLLNDAAEQAAIRGRLALVPLDAWSWRGVAEQWSTVFREHLEKARA